MHLLRQVMNFVRLVTCLFRMAFSEFKKKLSAFHKSHLQYVEKQKTLRDSTMFDDSNVTGEDNKHVYAVLPPVEYFMNLPPNIKKQHFFQVSATDT